MSRQLHLVEVTDKQLKALHKARLAAAIVLVVSFAGFVAFAPDADPKADNTASVAAAAEGAAKE